MSPSSLIWFDSLVAWTTFRSRTAAIVLIFKSASKTFLVIPPIAAVVRPIAPNSAVYPNALFAAWSVSDLAFWAAIAVLFSCSFTPKALIWADWSPASVAAFRSSISLAINLFFNCNLPKVEESAFAPASFNILLLASFIEASSCALLFCNNVANLCFSANSDFLVASANSLAFCVDSANVSLAFWASDLNSSIPFTAFFKSVFILFISNSVLLNVLYVVVIIPVTSLNSKVVCLDNLLILSKALVTFLKSIANLSNPVSSPIAILVFCMSNILFNTPDSCLASPFKAVVALVASNPILAVISPNGCIFSTILFLFYSL